MTEAAYRLVRPERRDTPVIFSSPHSGRDYPEALLARTLLDERSIRSACTTRRRATPRRAAHAGAVALMPGEGISGGRYWDRTSGFHRVKVALYR